MQMTKHHFSNVETFKKGSKSPQRYERFGEIIRYLTVEE
jgi:hypothetical protein